MALHQRSLPGGQIELEVRSVAVLVCVLELVERAILGIEQLSVAPEELLAKTVGLGHATPSLVRHHHGVAKTVAPSRTAVVHSSRSHSLRAGIPGPHGFAAARHSC